MAKHDDTTPNDLDDATQGFIDDLTERLADMEGRYKRALADYQNSQRRALENERRAHENGAAGVVERLVPVLDHMRLALDADRTKATTDSVLAGVRSILDEFTKVLAGYGVAVIEPRENDAFDPMRHEALMRAEKPGVKPGRIAQTFQIGYSMGERVIRPAKVSVAPGEESTSPAGAEASGSCTNPNCECGPECACDDAPHSSENFERPAPGDVRVHHHEPKPGGHSHGGGGGCCGGGRCH